MSANLQPPARIKILMNPTVAHGGGGGARSGGTPVHGGSMGMGRGFRDGRGRHFRFNVWPWWGGGWPWWGGGYPWWGGGYPYWGYPAGLTPYGAMQAQMQMRDEVICFDAKAGALFGPGSGLDGEPAAALATRQENNRTISLVSSPKFAQPRWLYNCP